MTSQVKLDSYTDAGLMAAIGLVNSLACSHAKGRETAPPDALPALRRILAIDPPSVAQLGPAQVPAFLALGQRLRGLFDRLDQGDLDGAAAALNDLLLQHPAHPHLAKENGIWRLHHHPADAALVPMWTSICAEAMARMIDGGYGDRFRACRSKDCDLVFFDVSKNGSRRFCSTTCQNRTKTAAFRRRQAPVSPPPGDRP